MKNKDFDITPKSLIGDILENHPYLEDRLIELAPVFKKLKNPILRKTIARAATLQQAAVIGGISVSVLINELRKASGLKTIETEESGPAVQTKPDWLKNQNIKVSYDASIDLENGIHPAAKVTKEILTFDSDDIYELITPFVPAPLIKIVEDKGFVSYTEQENENIFRTYFKKL